MSDAPFHVATEPIFGDLRVARNTLSAGVIFRDGELVKDGDDSLVLMISQSRNLNVTHRGRDLRLGHGDATLLDLGATGTFGSSQSFKYIPVLIPRQELEARVTWPEDLAWHRAPRRSEALLLLSGYLRSLQRSRLGDHAEARTIVRRHIIDLVMLAVTPHGAIGESNLNAVVAARRTAALDHIDACFHEPELSLATVARSQGISPRYLQRLLETSGTSFTGRVNELRLQRAFALLSEPRDGARRISDIALDVGFSDVSHFNRLFRSRFGDTPSGVRGQVRGATTRGRTSAGF